MKNKLFLTESEKNTILGMHKRAIRTETKIINEAATLEQVQQLLVDRGFELGNTGDGKGVDGKLGPKTLQAISDALAQFAKNPAGTQNPPAGTQNPPAGTQNLTAATPAGTQNPTAATPAGTQNPTAGGFKLAVNMEGKGNYEDEAKGRTYAVVSVNPLNCDVTEVVFKGPKQNDGTYKYQTIYAYYKTSEGSTGPAADRKEISFRSVGDGVQKSNNPCNEFKSFGNFGTLQFS